MVLKKKTLSLPLPNRAGLTSLWKVPKIRGSLFSLPGVFVIRDVGMLMFGVDLEALPSLGNGVSGTRLRCFFSLAVPSPAVPGVCFWAVLLLARLSCNDVIRVIFTTLEFKEKLNNHTLVFLESWESSAPQNRYQFDPKTRALLPTKPVG